MHPAMQRRRHRLMIRRTTRGHSPRRGLTTFFIVAVGVFVLFIGGIAARALGNIVRGATAEGGFSNPETLANISRTAVWSFAVVVAINQLGIATNLINTLFTGFVGALAIALGLAFGLGGRDLASRTLENWYDQAQDAKPKSKRARAPEG